MKNNTSPDNRSTSITPKGILRNKEINFHKKTDSSLILSKNNKSTPIFDNENNIYPSLRNSKFEDFFETINSDIDLSSLKRPFTINFREIKLKDTLESAIETKDDLTVISMKCILMIGKDKFSNKRKIIWRGIGKNLKLAIINRRIYFDTKYCDLPMYFKF